MGFNSQFNSMPPCSKSYFLRPHLFPRVLGRSRPSPHAGLRKVKFNQEKVQFNPNGSIVQFNSNFNRAKTFFKKTRKKLRHRSKTQVHFNQRGSLVQSASDRFNVQFNSMFYTTLPHVPEKISARPDGRWPEVWGSAQGRKHPFHAGNRCTRPVPSCRWDLL